MVGDGYYGAKGIHEINKMKVNRKFTQLLTLYDPCTYIFHKEQSSSFQKPNLL